MAFDIKAKIEEIGAKLKEDPNLMQSFQTDPIKTIEGIIGVDLPDDLVSKVVDGVKGLLAGDKLSGLLGSVKNLF